mmetsp:Transcript_14940/g.42223  ORF Transcript_14940/g.42223 Transcript_14940/m.42223 type:complete len:214 (+) Transcript_14940:316-957(+)
MRRRRCQRQRQRRRGDHEATKPLRLRLGVAGGRQHAGNPRTPHQHPLRRQQDTPRGDRAFGAVREHRRLHHDHRRRPHQEASFRRPVGNKSGHHLRRRRVRQNAHPDWQRWWQKRRGSLVACIVALHGAHGRAVSARIVRWRRLRRRRRQRDGPTASNVLVASRRKPTALPGANGGGEAQERADGVRCGSRRPEHESLRQRLLRLGGDHAGRH